MNPKDIITNETHTLMSKEAFGCHAWLLLHAWVEGSIPSDPLRIQRILALSNRAFKRVWPAIKATWFEDGERLKNRHLEAKRKLHLARQERAKVSGRKGGRPMKSTKPETKPFPNANPVASQMPRNPLLDGKRPALEQEALKLVREIQALTNEDGIEIIREASSYKDQRTGQIRTGATNPATMSDDRLLATVKDLRETLETERKRHGSA